MRSLLWFVFGVLVAMSGQSFAQWVDSHGNSLDTQSRSYGGAGYDTRDRVTGTGRFDPAPVAPPSQSMWPQKPC